MEEIRRNWHGVPLAVFLLLACWMLGAGAFVGIIAIMWCLFKCLGHHCDENYQDDAEEAIQPPTYSSLFGVEQEDPPLPYPGTQEKTDSSDGLIR